ncbi:MFS general substrate transporter [Rhizodiscina lignyota]|uniref:MFS general substrate transporter n=1 Tax=Rhizodiscina lignyota TaxID=1504668 RepID=A0A9P4ITE5_9PEZI|nr:MFS general substrate transporter [Rhizodiscina lignyota]
MDGAVQDTEKPLDDRELGSSAPLPTRDVEWETSDFDPLNWARSKKWTTVGTVSFHTFVSPLASSIMAPGLPEIGRHFNITSPTLLALTLTIYLLAWALGPMLLGPLSEVYGRRWVVNISGGIFTAFSIGCIFAQSAGQLVAFRFLAGIGACTPISIGSAIVADIFIPQERAPATAAYAMALLLGPPVGPVVGGYIAETIGFKYGFVLTAALGGCATLLSLCLLPETYAEVLRFRAERAGKLSGPQETEGGAGVHIIHASRRPIMLLIKSPICLVLSFYGALVYGYLNMFFTTFPSVFGDIYGFRPGPTGLTYVAGGLGELTATMVGGWLGQRIYLDLTRRNSGKAEPEFRIPGMILGSFAVPIGLFWFGWSAQAHVHWIVPILGSAVFGFGLMSVLLPMQLYLVDAFRYAASALAAAALFRSLLAFAIPLFAPQMIHAMGLGGTYSFLGGLSIAIGIPLPIWIYLRGKEIRSWSNLYSSTTGE